MGRRVLAGLGVALISLNGCFTVLSHPKSPDLDAVAPEEAYPHSSVVFGWYDHHYYGSYHDYYMGPVGYYPPRGGDSPSSTESDEPEGAGGTTAVLVPGFDRGGRGRDDPPRTHPVVVPQPVDDSSDHDASAGNASNPRPQTQSEQPKPAKKKTKLGGRGGRR